MKRNRLTCLISLMLILAIGMGMMCIGAAADPEITETCGICAAKGMEFLWLHPTTLFEKISETQCARRYICNNGHLVFTHNSDGSIHDAVDHTAATVPNCTVAAICSNCESEFGELGGHVYGEGVVRKPTCLVKGATVYTCTLCGHKLELDEVPVLSHWYDVWSPASAGQHSAPCKRPKCPYVKTTTCVDWKFTMTPDGADAAKTYSVCPICGAVPEGGVLEFVEEAEAIPVTAWTPRGDLVVRQGELNDGERVITVAFEFDAILQQYVGKCKFNVPAELLEGYQVMLVDDTGNEVEQDVVINGDTASFVLDFHNTVRGNLYTKVRVLHLVPVVEASESN